jgi:hypothetical protein
MNKNNKNVSLRSLAHSVRGAQDNFGTFMSLIGPESDVLNLNANNITTGFTNQLIISANFVGGPGQRPYRDGDSAYLVFYELNKITPDPSSINTINFYANDQLMLTLQVTYESAGRRYRVRGNDTEAKVNRINNDSTFNGYYKYIKNGELQINSGYITFQTNATRR